ncbi:MAG: hypothetical protein U0872_13490 [Planctomycetaceae bacterium]
MNVTNNGTFTGVGITLADQATDTLTVDGTADFEAGGGTLIGPAGTANFGSLTFNSTNAVSIQEDSATNLTGSARPIHVVDLDRRRSPSAPAPLNVTNNGPSPASASPSRSGPETLTVGGTAGWKPAVAPSSSARREPRTSAA